jgi:acyl-CoA thioester hydrolase
MTEFTFTDNIRVLAHECDFMGHVNNAAYIRYLQQVTLDALSEQNLIPSDAMRRLSIQYQSFARYGDRLAVSTWEIESAQSRLLLGYRIVRHRDGAPVVSAEIEWQYPGGPADGAKDTAPRHVVRPIKPLDLSGDEPSAYEYRSRYTVRRYELDQTGRVQEAVYFNWLEHATLQAADAVGWPLERIAAAGSVIIQYRHDAEFFEAARAADEVEIISRLVARRRASGTWLHDVVRAADGMHVMRDYSTGVWMNASDRVSPAPAGMMEACVAGPGR